jgi:hypothetical protein
VKALMVVKAQMNYHVMSPLARAKHNKKKWLSPYNLLKIPNCPWSLYGWHVFSFVSTSSYTEVTKLVSTLPLHFTNQTVTSLALLLCTQRTYFQPSIPFRYRKDLIFTQIYSLSSNRSISLSLVSSSSSSSLPFPLMFFFLISFQES